ncbi:MAG: hypothetical protein FWD15_00805 [Alphaproteobacteria bacterium]|nr:hypothetical protein [Alphaproteobacteria bacterium]
MARFMGVRTGLMGTLGSSGSKRHSAATRRKILMVLGGALLVFLAVWQMPVKQTEVVAKLEQTRPTVRR